MDILGGFKKAINASIHPSRNTKSMSIGDALKFYYNAAIIPFIIAIILGSIIAYAISSSLLLYAISIAIAYILILIPVGIIINAAIYHFFDKMLFKLFKGDISKTVTAFVYAEMPILMFTFILVPAIASIFTLGLTHSSSLTSLRPISMALFGIMTLISIWSLIIFIISLSKQQKISIGRSIAAFILPMIIIFIISFAVTFGVLLATH